VLVDGSRRTSSQSSPVMQATVNSGVPAHVFAIDRERMCDELGVHPPYPQADSRRGIDRSSRLWLESRRSARWTRNLEPWGHRGSGQKSSRSLNNEPSPRFATIACSWCWLKPSTRAPGRL
jgi:hypothetical protein